MTKSVLGPADPRTIELFEYLRAKLGIPDNVLSMSLHFSMDSAVEVDCTFMPAIEDEPEPLIENVH